MTCLQTTYDTNSTINMSYDTEYLDIVVRSSVLVLQFF